MAIRFFLILTWILSTPSFAQVLLESGQFAGTLPESQNSSPISYFVRDLEEFKQLEAWASDPENAAKIRIFSTRYDNFIVVSHPEGVVDGKINPKVSTLADEAMLAELSEFGLGVSRSSSACIAFWATLEKDEIKGDILIIYIVETGAQRMCLNAVFSQVSD